jgi:hypothetical protein
MPMSEEQPTASTMEAGENESWKLEPDRLTARPRPSARDTPRMPPTMQTSTASIRNC